MQYKKFAQKFISRFSDLKMPSQKARMIVGIAALLVAIVTPVAFADNQPPADTAEVSITENSAILSPNPAPSPESTPDSSSNANSNPISTPTTIKNPEPSATSRNAHNSPSPRTSRSNPSTPSVNPTPAVPVSTPQPSGILGYINQARIENDLVPLTYNSMLNSAAKTKSEDMLQKGYFAHTNPDGKTDFDFIREAGYPLRFAGSNIAQGNFGSEKKLFDAWMNSPGHRANILDSRAREFGFGSAGSYFTMMVGAR